MMKQTEQMKEIQERMKPGVIARDGFLGSDGRNLIDILVEDDAEVKRLNLTHEIIAARMFELREAGKEGLGDIVSISPNYEISVDIRRGKLACPFGHRGLIRKSMILVRNLEKGREITYTDMNIHMIKEHGFYQGKGSSFRLEIDDLVDILDIALPG
jgi:hypothetical protein